MFLSVVVVGIDSDKNFRFDLPKPVVNPLKVLRHQRTDGRTSREEEVDDENLALNVRQGHCVSQVVQKIEIQDAVVLLPHGRRIHQRRIQLRGLVDGQIVFRSEVHHVGDGHRCEEDDEKGHNAHHGQLIA